jgi:hypothetical protein
MDEHHGMTSYACPSCQARVFWRLSEARDGTDTEGHTGDNQGPLRVRVVVERWLPRHRKLVSITLTLLVHPDKAVRVLNASLYPPSADYEPTLSDVVAQTPTMLGEAAGKVIGELIGSKLIAPGGDCGLCAALAEALVGALVAILVEPLVAPLLLFLECVSVISALLPAGDVNLVSTSLVKRWTGYVLGEALVERWEQIFALCASTGLTELTVQPVEYFRPSLLTQPLMQSIEFPRPSAKLRADQAFTKTRPDTTQAPSGATDRASCVPSYGSSKPSGGASTAGAPVARATFRPADRQSSVRASPPFRDRPLEGPGQAGPERAR